ncbi:MAG: hypothetical protein AB1698_03605 [Pseudomonadota bacterium]
MINEGGHGQPPPQLRDYPYVVVRVRCNICGRDGTYRLAVLAERYGADCTLDDLVDALRKIRRACPYPLPWTVKPRKLQMVCHITLPDWWQYVRPPDMPPDQGMRLVVDNGEDSAA